MSKTPTISPPRCAASCSGGGRCRGAPVAGSQYCSFHDPGRAGAVAAGRSAGGERRSRPRAVVSASEADVEVRDAKGVCRLLSITINDVRKGRLDPKIANTVGYLAGVLVRAIEVGDLEERLAALEGAVHHCETGHGSFDKNI